MAGLAGKFKIRFTAPGLPSVVSGTVVISQYPHHLAIITQPGNGTSGLAIGTPPAIEVRDLADLPIRMSFAAFVQLIPVSGSGTLSGVAQQPFGLSSDANGMLVFTGLTITGAGSYQLKFTTPIDYVWQSQVVSNTLTIAP
jgi:hypothetical protein